MKIKIYHETDLDIVNNELTVKKASGSNISIESDGLYAEAKPGADGHGGTGYDDYYTQEGIRLGYSSPFSDAVKTPRMVTCTNYIHRMFDASDDDGQTLLNFRPSIDYVLAGDFYRVQQSNGKYKHFLVTATEKVTNGTTKITEHVELGVW